VTEISRKWDEDCREAAIGVMADAVYAIEDFPDDDLLWRIEWIGGVGYNTSVPSDPQIEICLAQLPAGETNPLSARSRSSQTKKTVRIAVGLLPYISIASVWQQRRPVIKDLAASRHRLCIDASLYRTVALAELANAIPRSSYLWEIILRALLTRALKLCPIAVHKSSIKPIC